MMADDFDNGLYNFTPIDAFTSKTGSTYLSFLFNDAQNSYLEKATTIFEQLASKSPLFASMINGLNANETVKLVFSDEAMQKIKSGEWNIVKSQNGDGLFRAWVSDGNTIKEHADISITNGMEGMDLFQIATAMQGMAMMKQLSEISDQLVMMNRAIDDVLAGQQNDRVGLYYSAEYQYKEALLCRNSEMRNRLICNAISAISECTEQTKQNTLYESHKIADNYNARKHVFNNLEINRISIPAIKTNLQLIHSASALKAAIYYREGEISNTICALKEYSFFLESFLPDDITKEALYYADSNSKTISDFWNLRHSLSNQIDKICSVLTDPTSLQLNYNKKEVII